MSKLEGERLGRFGPNRTREAEGGAGCHVCAPQWSGSPSRTNGLRRRDGDAPDWTASDSQEASRMSHRILDPRPVTTLPDYVRTGGGTAYDVARKVEPEAVIEEISAAGLRGRGGAGFPTGQKWATTFERETEVTTV